MSYENPYRPAPRLLRAYGRRMPPCFRFNHDSGSSLDNGPVIVQKHHDFLPGDTGPVLPGPRIARQGDFSLVFIIDRLATRRPSVGLFDPDLPRRFDDAHGPV